MEIGINVGINTVNSVAGGGALILDVIGGANTAYSLVSKLRADYTGDAFQIKDDAGTILNVGFVGDETDVAAVSGHALPSTGGTSSWVYLYKIFDQSGNGNDCTSSGTADPTLIDGEGLYLVNGKLAAKQNLSTHIMRSATLSPVLASTVGSMYLVSNNTVAVSQSMAVVGSGAAFIGLAANDASNLNHGGAGTPTTYVNGLAIGDKRADYHTAAGTIQSITSWSSLDLTGLWDFIEMNYSPSAAWMPRFGLQEFIVYDKATNRALVEANQAARFSISLTEGGD